MKVKILEKAKNILCSSCFKEWACFAAKAGLFAIIVALVSILMADIFYQEKPILKQGYIPEAVIAKVDNSNGDKSGNAKQEVKAVDINELIAKADLAKGEKLFKKCAACHGIEKGGADKIGPNLFAVVGKNKAFSSTFKYSNGLKTKGGKWTVEDLNQWLTKPKDYISDTKMSFPGLKKDTERADVIAYLKSVNK